MACVHFHTRKVIWLLSRKGWAIGWRHIIGSKMPTAPENSVLWMPKDGIAIDYTEATAWLETEEAKGMYWCESTWPPNLKPDENGNVGAKFDEIGNTWRFTDPNTAFAFKMRFL